MNFSILLLCLAYFHYSNADSYEDRSLKFGKVVGTTSSWPQLYNSIKKKQPLLLHNACIDNKAYRLWSPEYIYYHPGAALIFRNLTKKSSASIRKIVEQRDYFMQLHFRVPDFLSDDLKLPKCLECRELTENIKTPSWLWRFQDAPVNLHDEKSHELWCVITGSISMIILPEWTDGMIDHFLTKDTLSTAPDYRKIKFYEAEFGQGDCFYVPGGSLRQWQSSKDTMAIIYQIPDSVLNAHKEKLETCKPNPSSTWVVFDDNYEREEGTENYSHELERFVSYLGKKDCLDRNLFHDSIINDPDLRWLDGKSTRDHLSKDIFVALDRDKDGQFCWSDIDSLTQETVAELAEFMKTKAVMLENGLKEFQRRGVSKWAQDIFEEGASQDFLDEAYQSLIRQYGKEKLGKIFSGSWVSEDWDERNEEQNNDQGHKHDPAEF